MDSHADLNLPEQLMLLMLRDDTGTMESHTSLYQLALGGAILTELMLSETVRIEDDKKKLVRMERSKALSDPVLDDCRRLVAEAKRPRPAQHWITIFGGQSRLRHRIAEGLCRRGILEESEDKVLFFFTRAVYPTINPKPEKRLVDSLREAVLGSSSDVAPSTALLVSLAHATSLMRIHFSKEELKDRKARIEQLTSGDLVGRIASDAVMAAQQATQAAVMSAIIASTVVTSVTHS